MVASAGPDLRSGSVVLRVPRGIASLPVLRVVIGGLASRYALSVDSLDDLELAVETLVVEEPSTTGELSLTLSVVEENFLVTMAGLRSPVVWRALSDTTEAAVGRLDAENVLRMIMSALVDRYRAVEGGETGSFAVEMEKRIA